MKNLEITIYSPIFAPHIAKFPTILLNPITTTF